MTILDDIEEAIILAKVTYDWEKAYSLDSSQSWKFYVDRFKESGDAVMTTPPEVMVKWAKILGLETKSQVGEK